jgi:tetratricopeptide (TPR) repeat protein
VGDSEGAISAFRNAIKWDAENVGLQLGLVEALMADGRPQAAHTVVVGILAKHPDHMESLSWQARVHEARGYVDAAVDVWQRVYERDPDYPGVRQHLAEQFKIIGDEYIYHGNFPEAVEAYQGGLSYFPSSIPLRVSIGLAYAEYRNPAFARRSLARVLEENSDQLEAYYLVIRAWIHLGERNQVFELAERAQHLSPPPPVRFFLDLVGYCLAKTEYELAEDLLEWIEGLEIDQPKSLVELAILFQEIGDGDKAIGLLRQAVKSNPDLAEAHMWLGAYYFSEMGQTHLARQHLDKADALARRTEDALTLMHSRMIRDVVFGGTRELPDSYYDEEWDELLTEEEFALIQQEGDTDGLPPHLKRLLNWDDLLRPLPGPFDDSDPDTMLDDDDEDDWDE